MSRCRRRAEDLLVAGVDRGDQRVAPRRSRRPGRGHVDLGARCPQSGWRSRSSRTSVGELARAPSSSRIVGGTRMSRKRSARSGVRLTRQRLAGAHRADVDDAVDPAVGASGAPSPGSRRARRRARAASARSRSRARRPLEKAVWMNGPVRSRSAPTSCRSGRARRAARSARRGCTCRRCRRGVAGSGCRRRSRGTRRRGTPRPTAPSRSRRRRRRSRCRRRSRSAGVLDRAHRLDVAGERALHVRDARAPRCARRARTRAAGSPASPRRCGSRPE